MSHAYRNAAAFKRAQYVWDNMAPPEGGPCECAECNGTGLDGDLIECIYCDGTGQVTEDGEPWFEGEEA